jgi:hypothetical protein
VDVEEPDEVESEPVAVSVPLDVEAGVPDPSAEASPPAGAAVPDWVCGLLTVPLPLSQAVVVRPRTAIALTSRAARRRDWDEFAIFNTPGGSPHALRRASPHAPSHWSDTDGRRKVRDSPGSFPGLGIRQ